MHIFYFVCYDCCLYVLEYMMMQMWAETRSAMKRVPTQHIEKLANAFVIREAVCTSEQKRRNNEEPRRRRGQTLAVRPFIITY